eukprot:TRINITY_DN12196_c0_g1_i1.p1 TRINITY_DN12196_c0_g1~~TRINITY_DN12196_c0_g1_i1.p1  ORF type:complete len:242 (-),score=23.03 TRINITY_DN12196_c0_g1_i1:80-805(-)
MEDSSKRRRRVLAENEPPSEETIKRFEENRKISSWLESQFRRDFEVYLKKYPGKWIALCARDTYQRKPEIVLADDEDTLLQKVFSIKPTPVSFTSKLEREWKPKPVEIGLIEGFWHEQDTRPLVEVSLYSTHEDLPGIKRKVIIDTGSTAAFALREDDIRAAGLVSCGTSDVNLGADQTAQYGRYGLRYSFDDEDPSTDGPPKIAVSINRRTGCVGMPVLTDYDLLVPGKSARPPSLDPID